MSRKLKGLRIREISSVDKGAAEDAQVVLFKRAVSEEHPTGDGGVDRLPGPYRGAKPRRRNLYEIQADARAQAEQDKPKMKAMIAVAKSVLAGHPTAHTADDFYAALLRGGEKVRKRGDSPEQALARFAESEDGRALMAAYKRLHLGKAAPSVMNTAPNDFSNAYRRMMDAARETARQTGEDENVVFARIYADPANANLTAEDKAHHFTRATAVALPLPGSTGPALRPDQQPDYRKPLTAKKVLKRLKKLQKRQPGLSRDAAMTKIYRGEAA